MPSIQTDARFLGLDLSALGRSVRQAWSDLQGSPLLSWLTPEAPIILLQQDGGESLWWGGTRRVMGGKKIGTPFIAVELPDDLLLRRTLTVPAMGESDTASAAALQVRSISPFAEHDLVWGYRTRPDAAGGSALDLALASRKQIAQCIQSHSARLGAKTPEVWVDMSAGPPIVLSGYGEGLRRAQGGRGRWARYGLLASALVLMAAILVTPTLQLRARAIEAVGAYDGAVHRTPTMVKDREALMQSVEKLNVLSELLAGRVEPMRVLDRLTKVLPDDTALQGLTLKGLKVTITGLTANASALMQILGEQPGVRDVRAPTPTTRVGGANSKENFVIEFSLDPQEFGVAMVQSPVSVVAPLSASSAASAAAPVAAVAAPASAPTASVSAPSSAAVAPPAAPGALVPVFGGSAPQAASKPSLAKPERKGTP
ncbi:general secretion pathway protein L [Acidovorax sp. 69]|uniref:PilN domain-containing protein n=1 Tax=Acidovorax sp. 69 TaxID=2035202 RepID=UPI000CC40C54|nr:PilN domain-containing protein [Acidovorax sp. 69]PJI99199.1 general secretion pathway protein L [Acidovorax sp. 69]